MVATLNRQFKNIYVLFGFHYGKYKEFVQAIVNLGPVITERKLDLIYGGGDQDYQNMCQKLSLFEEAKC